MKLLEFRDMANTMMVYVGQSNKSQTHGKLYRIRSTINVGNKTYFEFYDNRSRIKISSEFMGVEKYTMMKSNENFFKLMTGLLKNKNASVRFIST